ncbi:hypothetical protein C8R44DRAFT_934392 [Mycena epipterygia]|nr:hypothetical protein C8R44DRAFT_934392 [Mycena epipterygia]
MSALLLQGAPIRLLPRGPTLWLVFVSTLLAYRFTCDDLQGAYVNAPVPGVIYCPRTTLDPELLKCEDVLDLPQRKRITVRFQGSDGPGASLHYTRIAKSDFLSFPPHSRRFLYYHSEAHAPPVETSVRFRVTPASFLHGQYLLSPCRLPWRITLPQIPCHQHYARIRDQLLHENLATEGQLSHCRDVFQGQYISPQYTLFRLESTFFVKFQVRMHLTAVGDVLHTLRLYPLEDLVSRPSLVRTSPARLHLRIVKITELPMCTVEGYKGRVLKPEEGESLKVSVRGGVPEPWASILTPRSNLPWVYGLCGTLRSQHGPSLDPEAVIANMNLPFPTLNSRRTLLVYV